MNTRPKLTKPSDVRAWIATQQFLPSKVLGQNFLIDENILRIMLEAAALNERDRVLEVGPGLGILTEPLMERAERVVAIEKDKRLGGYLAEAFGSHPRFTLVVSDALDLDLGALVREHRLNKFVANLPYSAGSRILVECFHHAPSLERMVVTVQLEVGERLAAPAGSDDYGLLSIWAQLDYRVAVAKRISPSCFHPRPQVTSAIVTLEKSAERRAALRDASLFDALVKRAFSQRRKQLGTILEGFPAAGGRERLRAHLDDIGIDPRARPEILTIANWIALADTLAGVSP